MIQISGRIAGTLTTKIYRFEGVAMMNWIRAKIMGRSSRLRFQKPGEMNKTERAYAEYLERLKLGGQICDWKYEAVKLRLADKTFYTPDFMVVMPDGVIELREVKGHWEDDARVKIKVAAEQFPFRFIAVRKGRGGSWEKEEF